MLLVLDNCEHLLDACAASDRRPPGRMPNVDAPGDEPRAARRRRRGDLAGAVAIARRRGDRAVRRSRPPSTPGFQRHRRQRRRPWPRSAGASTACRWRSNSRRPGACSVARPRSSTACTTGSGCSPAAPAPRCGASRRLRASVDWSHALLTEPERILFRRLAVFIGGFDLDAAQAVAGATDVERYQVLDQLTLLVDKSLVVAENASGRTRYRLLETVRQYALEKLGESGEADDTRRPAPRPLHRDGSAARHADASARREPARAGRYSKSTICAPHSSGAGRTAKSNNAMKLVTSLQSLWVFSWAPGGGGGMRWRSRSTDLREVQVTLCLRGFTRGRWPTGRCSTLWIGETPTP